MLSELISATFDVLSNSFLHSTQLNHLKERKVFGGGCSRPIYVQWDALGTLRFDNWQATLTVILLSRGAPSQLTCNSLLSETCVGVLGLVGILSKWILTCTQHISASIHKWCSGSWRPFRFDYFNVAQVVICLQIQMGEFFVDSHSRLARFNISHVLHVSQHVAPLWPTFYILVMTGIFVFLIWIGVVLWRRIVYGGWICTEINSSLGRGHLLIVKLLCYGYVLFTLELLVYDPIFSNLLNVGQMSQSWIAIADRKATLSDLVAHILRVNHRLNVVQNGFTALLIFVLHFESICIELVFAFSSRSIFWSPRIWHIFYLFACCVWRLRCG